MQNKGHFIIVIVKDHFPHLCLFLLPFILWQSKGSLNDVGGASQPGLSNRHQIALWPTNGLVPCTLSAFKLMHLNLRLCFQ